MQVVWLYPDGRGASVVVPEAAAEELGGVRADYTYHLCVLGLRLSFVRVRRLKSTNY